MGKSTTTVNLAAALGKQGRKVLIVDFDPQGNSTSGIGVDKEGLSQCIYDALLHDVPAENLIHDTVSERVFIILPPSSLQVLKLSLFLQWRARHD